MMLKVIDRYTIAEAFLIMLAGGLLVGGIFLGTSEFKYILNLICDVGMSPELALSISLLQMPGTFVWALPAAVILSASLILWRRNSDFELVALAASGINPFRNLAPLLLIALAFSVLAFFVGEYVVPEARSLSNRLIYVGALQSEMPRNRNSLTLLRSSRVDGAIDRVFLIGRYLKTNLENAMVLDFSNPQATKVIWSRKGKYKNGQWLLLDGIIYDLSDSQDARLSMRFSKMSYDAIGLNPSEMLSKGVLTQDMTSREILSSIRQLERSGKAVPPLMWLTYFKRYSQPLSCLLVVFAAMPLLVIRRKQSVSGGLVYIGISIVLFFFSQQCTISLAQNGLMSPLLASGLPCLLVTVLGLAGYVSTKLNFLPIDSISNLIQMRSRKRKD